MYQTHTIFITRPIPESAVKALRDAGHDVTVREKKTAPSKKELIHALRARPYTVLVSFLTDTVDAAVFDACPSIALVANYAVGYNNIDTAAAKARGIAVTNTQGTSGNAVAEFTVALMLALVTRLVEGDRFVRAKEFTGWDPYLLLGTDMQGKVVGLLGAGEIGSLVARKLIGGFGVRVLYYDIARSAALDALGATFVPKDVVLRDADIVSLHVPLLPTTHHFVDAAAIAQMKQGAYLVNTARGPVVDEAALISALETGKLAGAALDVYEFEPTVHKKLRSLPCVITTPHIASARTSVREAMGQKVVENIKLFAAGSPFINVAQ